MNITMGGNPLTLIGNEVKVGEKAPMFKAINKNLEEVSLEQFLGKVVVLTSFPSIDTGICAMQAAKFNNELAKYEDEVSIITISNDLPFLNFKILGISLVLYIAKLFELIISVKIKSAPNFSIYLLKE